jgi:hypothetical protein
MSREKRAKHDSDTALLKRRRCTQRVQNGARTLEHLPADIIGSIASFLEPLSLASTLDCASRRLRISVSDCQVWRDVYTNESYPYALLQQFLSRRGEPRCMYSGFRNYISGFRTSVPTNKIVETGDDRDVVYMNAVINVQRLNGMGSDSGVYMEVSVYNRSDHMSFCLVDFEGNGTSSITFSPDAGAVIKETRSPDDGISGDYTAALRRRKHFGVTSPSKAAIFISTQVGIVFMRFFEGNWESTGPVANLEWASGGVITPCVAFRDAGRYEVKIERVCICKPPPHIHADREPLIWKPLLFQRD